MYNVLLVDDEPAILESLKRTIGRDTPKFTVVGEAFSVDQAKLILEKEKVDVLITDIKMPKKSGIQLLQYVNEKWDNKSIVCIVISGYSDFQYVRESFLYGVYDYLLKPVVPKKLAELLNKVEQDLNSVHNREHFEDNMQVKISGEELVRDIEMYLKEHLKSDNSILSICDKYMISQPYLSKIFKKYKGITYNEFLIEMKIEKAKSFLLSKDEYLIKDIADTVGFSDQFYFSKVFKTVVGCTPREFRKRNE